jgi:hypothetical protein
MSERIAKDVRADRRKGAIELAFIGWYRFPFANFQFDKAVERLQRWIMQRDRYLKEHLYETSVGVTIFPEIQGRIQVEVSVGGNSGVYFDSGKIPGKMEYILPSRERVKRTSGGSPLLLMPGVATSTFAPHPALRLNREPQHVIVPAVQRYRLSFRQTNPEKLKVVFEKAFRHALTQKELAPAVSLQRNEGEFQPYNTETLHLWSIAHPGSTAVVLGPGEVRLKEDRVIPIGTRLRVLPGTVLQLSAGVELRIEGEAEFVGKSGKEINVFLENDAQITLHAQEPGAGSVFQYCNFFVEDRKSSGTREVEGALSVLDAESVRFQNVQFSMNTSPRTALRQIYGRANLKDVSFNTCGGDCFQSVYGEVQGESITFRDSVRGVVFVGAIGNLTNLRMDRISEEGIVVSGESRLQARKVVGEQVETVLSLSDSARVLFEDVTTSRCKNGLDVGEQGDYFVHPPALAVSGKQYWRCVATLAGEGKVELTSRASGGVNILTATEFVRAVGDEAEELPASH